MNQEGAEANETAPAPGAADDQFEAQVARRRRRTVIETIAIGALLVVSAVVAVAIGQADINVATVWQVITGDLRGDPDPVGVSTFQDNIVWQLRIPRVLLAATVGAGLAVVGAVVQTLTRNPMADPYLLGISSGAAFGAVLVLVVGLGAGALALPIGAFLGALGAFALVVALGSKNRSLTPIRMVLAGVAIAQLFATTTSLVVIWVGDPHATQQLEFWLAGSLAAARWSILGVPAAALLLALVVFIGRARTLDAFAFGEDAAAALGINVNAVRWVLLMVAALLTGTLVAVSGTIGFVGLILPHSVRLLIGPKHRPLLPVVALVGAVFLIWVDTLARTVFEPRELPVGIVTALIGVPAFIVLLRRSEVRS